MSPSRNLLARGPEEVRVEPRLMDVLVYLAERADQVVSKEDLLNDIWRDRCVTDDALTVTIHALRKALGDDAQRPRYIETISRRGYRWIAQAVDASVSSIDNIVAAPAEAPPRRFPPLTVPVGVIVWAVAGVALGIGASWSVTSPRAGAVHSPEAHEATVKGRYLLDRRTVEGCRQALEQFQRAVFLERRNPAAHAGLADTYSCMSDLATGSPVELRERAMAAARRALDLNPKSAEAHAALGRAQFLFDWDFSAAERSLTTAVALDPDYAPAHQAMAWFETARGRHREAVSEAERALQLDPVSPARYRELVRALIFASRYGEALTQVERARQLNPDSADTYLLAGWVRELKGETDAAFDAYRTAMRLRGAAEESLQRLDTAYRTEGLAGYYRQWLDRTDSVAPLSETSRARLFVRVGQFDRALQSLERAYGNRESALAWMKVEPAFRALRSDARFQDIAARIERKSNPH